MIKVVNIHLPLTYTEDIMRALVSERLGVDEKEILSLIPDRFTLVKDEGELYFKTTFLCELEKVLEEKLLVTKRKKGVSPFSEEYCFKTAQKSALRPVVVGFGPSGIFASLVLAKAGLCPIVLERGRESESRVKAVERFMWEGIFDEETNIQFGEGGAGAFSDGKLKVGHKDARRRMILSELISAGAHESINYLEKAHVGSDVLRRVIVNIRKKIISLGGEILFGAKVVDIDVSRGAIRSLTYIKDGVEHTLDSDNVVFAIGHSARDTYQMLYDKGISMKSKGFGVGVRIEHPQELINAIEYGDASLALRLGSADYKMVTHLDNGRSLYTFCMCPGGQVVPASSEKGSICTNGMSNFARDGVNANTALLVSVTPSDFPSDHPLAGIEYQREIERKAYALSGSFSAPAIKLCDFLEGRESTSFGSVLPTYRPSVVFASPDRYLPDYVNLSLRQGIKNMCEWKAGYYFDDAVITGPETRTTAPLRINRRDSLEADGVDGFYPTGEGAGYAGGIISSALDGVLVAEKIVNKLNFQEQKK